MANLNGQSADGANTYKGLINLGVAVGSVMSSSLQKLTDGTGASLPVNVSENEFNVPANCSVDEVLLVKTRVVWLSPDGHYWEETINNAGEKQLADLGTTPPF